jgi:hypothetical protein
MNFAVDDYSEAQKQASSFNKRTLHIFKKQHAIA